LGSTRNIAATSDGVRSTSGSFTRAVILVDLLIYSRRFVPFAKRSIHAKSQKFKNWLELTYYFSERAIQLMAQQRWS
jgi:hypothetical protein